jgi:hypothetical protein
MTMETLALFHVFISFNLHIFDNHLVTCRFSACLAICHTSKVVPQRRYNKGYFGYTLKECKSQHFLHYKFWGEITLKSYRPEPFFPPKTTRIGHIVTQALVQFCLSDSPQIRRQRFSKLRQQTAQDEHTHHSSCSVRR